MNDSSINNTDLSDKITRQIEYIRSLAGSGNTDFSALDTSNRGSERTFIRSTFAEGKGLEVAKTYHLIANPSRDMIQAGDKIRVEITLTNS